MPAIPTPKGPAYGVAARHPLPAPGPRLLRLYDPVTHAPIDVHSIDAKELVRAGYLTELPTMAENVESPPRRARAARVVTDEPRS